MCIVSNYYYYYVQVCNKKLEDVLKSKKMQKNYFQFLYDCD